MPCFATPRGVRCDVSTNYISTHADTLIFVYTCDNVYLCPVSVTVSAPVSMSMSVCVCAYVSVCVLVLVLACVRAYVHAYSCMIACVHAYQTETHEY